MLADGVARVARDQDVAGLGMHHAVHELTAVSYTHLSHGGRAFCKRRRIDEFGTAGNTKLCRFTTMK